jgi:hypothetical protein
LSFLSLISRGVGGIQNCNTSIGSSEVLFVPLYTLIYLYISMSLS